MVESQDWWLRDQASLVVGFDNWLGVSGRGGGALDLDGIAGVGVGDGRSFYASQNGSGVGNTGGNGLNGLDGYMDDDWNYL